MTAILTALVRAIALSLISARTATSTVTGTGIDMIDYEGTVLATLDAAAATAGTNPTLDVKLQECDTVGGTYTDVPSGAFVRVTDVAGTAGVQQIAFEIGVRKRFLRALGTIGGTSTPTFAFSAMVTGQKKYQG